MLLAVALLAGACGGSAARTTTTTAPPPASGDPRIADLLARLEATRDPEEQASLHVQIGSILWEASCPEPVYGLCIAKTKVTAAARTTCASYQLESVTSNIAPVARDAGDAATAVAHFEAAVALDGASPITAAARLALIDRDFEEAFGHPFPTGLDFERDPQGAAKQFETWLTATVAALGKVNAAYAELAAADALHAADPSYRFAAAYRIGSLAQWFADQLFQAPVPVNLQADADLYQVYCDALFDQAEPLEAKALATFRACVADAAAEGVTGTWPEQCQRELEALDPTLVD